MDFKIKPKRVPRLGDSLKNTIGRRFLWKAIDAGRVGQVLKELSESVKELGGCKMVSWRDGILKIKVTSSPQRQEIVLKQKKILEALSQKGVEAKEIKVIF